MAKQVNASDLKSEAFGLEGSTPSEAIFTDTRKIKMIKFLKRIRDYIFGIINTEGCIYCDCSKGLKNSCYGPVCQNNTCQNKLVSEMDRDFDETMDAIDMAYKK